MEQCSRQRRARHPFSGTALLTARRGHGLCQGLDAPPSLRECSLAGRYRIRVCRVAGPVSPIRLRRSRVGPEDRFCEAVRNDLRVPLMEGQPGQCAAFRPAGCDIFTASSAFARGRRPGRGAGGRGSGIRRGPRAAGHRGRRARQPPRPQGLRPKDAAKAAAPQRRVSRVNLSRLRRVTLAVPPLYCSRPSSLYTAAVVRPRRAGGAPLKAFRREKSLS